MRAIEYPAHHDLLKTEAEPGALNPGNHIGGLVGRLGIDGVQHFRRDHGHGLGCVDQCHVQTGSRVLLLRAEFAGHAADDNFLKHVLIGLLDFLLRRNTVTRDAGGDHCGGSHQRLKISTAGRQFTAHSVCILDCGQVKDIGIRHPMAP